MALMHVVALDVERGDGTNEELAALVAEGYELMSPRGYVFLRPAARVRAAQQLPAEITATQQQKATP